MDETRLIKLAQEGDLTAYNRLVLLYQDAVFNIVYRIMGDGAAAADITQDAFVSAYHAISRFSEGSFKAWLIRIATNACYDEFRRRKRRPQTSLDEMTAENDSPAFLQSDEPGPEQIRQRHELVQAIQDCLKRLPEDQRVALVLCDVEEYDYNEIAAIITSSLGTVKSRISRARTKLRDCLQAFRELLPTQYRLENG
ncbi:MAG: sigma-70 family RNA polymerase sigma factor [Chloroflexi bacterium]|nr:sigma-70 family RNA polymerase sigma factor [Chloroflexota bacterium]MBP8057505.1 sigma-70 family RNA polymerase sigma factor [Chloroflexota bacterium]